MKGERFSFNQRIAIILLIVIFTISGIIACSSDAITGGRGSGYSYSGGDGGDGGTSGGDGSTGGDGGASGGDGSTGGDGGTSGGDGSTGGDGGTSGGDGSTGGDGGASGGDGTTKPDTTTFPSDTFYKIRVPFGVSGDGYTNVSYMDTNKLKQLWFDQINRKAANDGKVFAIRNRGNDRNINNFQNGDQDYYYFNDNGDIVYKPDNTIIKKFMGAIITPYRDVEITRGGHNIWINNSQAIIGIKVTTKNIYTVGAIYANTLTTEQAKTKYLVGGAKQGVYDFVTYWHEVETFNTGAVYANNIFERQYINPGFIEVLVMYDYYDKKEAGCAAVHSYYAYYGIYNHYKEYANHKGIYFTSENMPYMTNHNIYLGQRPDYTSKQLNHTAAFTDNHRSWNFMFMPGHKN